MDRRALSIAEAILFASGEAVELDRLASALETDCDSAREILRMLSDEYTEQNRGLRIVEVGNSFRMCTNPRYTSALRRMFDLPPKRKLTPAMLETLAIVAVRQPVTKSEIEEIRGVSADHAVNRLMQWGLVTEAGRGTTPGKPILFCLTDECLVHFGFKNMDEIKEAFTSLDKTTSADK